MADESLSNIKDILRNITDLLRGIESRLRRIEEKVNGGGYSKDTTPYVDSSTAESADTVSSDSGW